MYKYKILFTGLISTVISVVVYFVILLLFSKEFTFGYFIFAVMMVSGSVMIPAAIGFLFFALFAGLLLWAVGDVVAFNGGFDNLTFDRIKKDFVGELLAFIPIVAMLSITIPIVYKRLSK